MSNELTDVRCPCGDEYPADSYDAGFIAGSGMCQNCDAALPPKDICTCPSGDGSLRHPCPAHPALVEQAGGDERVVDGKPRATKCPDCGEGDLMPGDLCACGYETDPAAGYACSECDGSGEGCVGEVCRECDGSGWFVTPEQARAALAQPSPAQAEQHWPKLEKPVQVGAIRFHAGLSSRLVVEAAQRLYEFESTPEKEAERIERLQAFREQLDPLNLAPHAEAFNEAPDEALRPEQAEAERPEVVAYRTIGRHTKHQHPHYALNYYKQNAEDQAAHWRERGCEVSEDELMTVAQHDRIVGELRAENAKLSEALDRWPLIRDSLKLRLADALARVAELELKLDKSDYAYDNDRIHMRGLAARAIARAKVFDDGSDGADAESARSVVAILRELLAVGPAQAQHSVPEEFSFEYRHPNGECHTVTVSREQVINEMPDFLFEALCSKFCNCEPVGETNVVECCCDEYAEEFKLIAAAPGKEGV
ncbi:hypothetical protein HMPREF1223_12292 [Pseudomonas aeruginosa str. Stone 130]|uniref:hypothetical protein n=1 Tax=Pseudomonas aeruginosa TaxID=287 RepID=UPI0002CC46D5|nr:hypothetical protein [Pseudomonas aeruginosa]EMZ50108.1 hypothetical protein HMPREF1223_12292 [Pseudomonas aeruginosa str. Stone 130]